MIDLGIALLLDQAGYGEYGKTIFWNVSPVFGSGEVSTQYGIWVNSQPIGVNGDMYTDTVTIATRYNDPLKQGEILADLMKYARDSLKDVCAISLDPYVKGFTYKSVDIKPPAGISFDAVDGEGRWVKSLHMDVSYKLPTADDPVWESMRMAGE